MLRARARSSAVVITGAAAGAKQKEIASIFRPFRALIHRFSNLRAAPGAIFLSAFQAGLIPLAPTGMYRKNSHRLALSITPYFSLSSAAVGANDFYWNYESLMVGYIVV